MLTLEKLTEDTKPFHNDICILYDSVLVRLVGIADDGDDFYYIVREMSPKGEYYASAVGHIISLRPTYPTERYKYMSDIFEMNGASSTEEFEVRMLDPVNTQHETL